MAVLLPLFENQNVPTHCRKFIFMTRQNPGRWRPNPGRWRPEPNLAGHQDESINPGLYRETRMNWIPRSRLKVVGIFHWVKFLLRKDRLSCRVSSLCHLVCVFAESGPTEDESILWKYQETQADAVRWV